MTDFENEPKGISRRSVVKGAAWAVPVIALASATPAFAASAEIPEPGDHCYLGGESVNAFRFYVQQPTNVGDIITIKGDALLEETTVVGVGITLSYVGVVDGARQYQVTATEGIAYPYIKIAGVNTTGTVSNRMLTVTQTQDGVVQSWTKEFHSSTTNCQIYDK